MLSQLRTAAAALLVAMVPLALGCESLAIPVAQVEGGPVTPGTDAGPAAPTGPSYIPAGAIKAPPTEILGINIETWALVDGDNKLTAFEYAVPLSLVQLMNDTSKAYTSTAIKIPEVVSQQSIIKFFRFDHIPFGHPPTGVYDFAHYELHFFQVTEPEVEKIDCLDLKQPTADVIPPSFEVFGEPGFNCFKLAGIHTYDKESQEYKGQLFRQTTSLTYYGGNLVSIEPKITLSLLLTRPAELKLAMDRATAMRTLNMAAPSLVPTDMVIKTDTNADVLVFHVGNFVMKQ